MKIPNISASRLVAVTFTALVALACDSVRAGISRPPTPVEVEISGPDTAVVPDTPFTVSVSVRVTAPVVHTKNYGDMIHYRFGSGIQWLAGDTLVILRLAEGFKQTYNLQVAARDTGDFTMNAYVRTNRLDSSDARLQDKQVFSGVASDILILKVQTQPNRSRSADDPVVEDKDASGLDIQFLPPPKVQQDSVKGEDTSRSSSALPATSHLLLKIV